MRYLRALALLAFVAASVGAQTPHAVVAHVLGEPGWIGIVPDSTDPLVIRRVVEGTPANRNGLRPGDRIVEIDGKPASAEVLYHHRFKVNESVALRIMRGTERLNVLSMPIVENPYYALARRDSVTRASATYLEDLLNAVRLEPQRYLRVSPPISMRDPVSGAYDVTFVVPEQRTALYNAAGLARQSNLDPRGSDQTPDFGFSTQAFQQAARDVEAALAQVQALQEQQRVMALQVDLLRAQSANRQAEQSLIDRKTQMADQVAALQRRLSEIAVKTQQDLARVSQHLAQAADSVRVNKVAERIRYSAQLIRETDATYARGTEKQIAIDLEAAAQQLRRAAELVATQREQSVRDSTFARVREQMQREYSQLNQAVRQSEELVQRLATSQRLLGGAQLEQLNPSLGEYFGGVSEGVFVLRTTEGTPAVTAGLRAGDIVESVNGRRITTIDQLLTAVSEQTGPINLAIVRRGQRSTISLRR